MVLTRDEFNEAVARAGGLKKVMEATGAGSIQAVSNWGARGKIPPRHCRAFSELTGIPIQDLRDDWRDFWPELAHRASK